jgi:hypothetical protein
VPPSAGTAPSPVTSRPAAASHGVNANAEICRNEVRREVQTKISTILPPVLVGLA